MNNNIKEILDKLKDNDWYDELDLTGDKWIELKQTEINKLLDYITNLQQENERLKELIDADNESYDIQETIINRQKSELLEQEDYKSRCEKAIEYIKYNDNNLYTYEPDYDYEENLVDNYEPSNFREDLLNILQNGSDEDE